MANGRAGSRREAARVEGTYDVSGRSRVDGLETLDGRIKGGADPRETTGVKPGSVDPSAGVQHSVQPQRMEESERVIRRRSPEKTVLPVQER